MISRYAIGAALVAILASAGVVAWKNARIASLASEIERLEANIAVQALAVSGCNARMNTFLEDQARDTTIDTLSDDALRDAASEWLRQ